MATHKQRAESADPIFAAEMEAIATARREGREVGFQAAWAERMERWPKERKPEHAITPCKHKPVCLR